MKKIMVLMAVLFCLIFAGSPFADTAEDNFLKAGQTLLAQEETHLLQLAGEIDKLVDEMPKDGIITGAEMKSLKKLIKEFYNAKSAADGNLAFYGLLTETNIPIVIQEIKITYFGNSDGSNYKDNEKQDIKRFFVEKTGQDIVVEKCVNYGIRLGVGFIIGLICGCTGFLWGLVVAEVGDKGLAACFFAPLIAVMLFFLIL